MDASSAILLKLKFNVLRVFHPSSTLRALKSFTLFFYTFKEMRFGNTATK